MADETGKRGSVARRVIVGVVALLVVAYGAGVWWFGQSWVPGATVNGIDVSGADDATVAVALADAADAWQGRVWSAGGFELELSATDVGLTVDGEAVAAQAREQVSAWAWPLHVADPPEVRVAQTGEIDEARLDALVDDAVAAFDEEATGPTDAAVSYDEETDAYVVSAEALGTALEGEAVRVAARELATSLAAERELGEDALVAPSRVATDEALVAACEKANALAAHEVALVWDEEELGRADAERVRGWVRIEGGSEVSLDAEAIGEWVAEVAADELSYQDDLHYYALDSERAVEDVESVLASEQQEARVELAAEVTGDKPPLSEGADKRGRHLDVNLTTQYARFYNGSGRIIWESYIVSGNTSNGHDTPTGDFSILSKQRSRTLVGADENHDGEPDYRTYVEYWMLFRSGGYGLHDAYWRDEFGGDIYTYDGSHGCVNLPPERAAELYDIVSVGDRVYVHW